MVSFLYSVLDFFCIIIISIISLQNTNVGQKQKIFRIYLLVLSIFCLLDGCWGVVASHSVPAFDTVYYLKLTSTLFYFFSAFTAFSWLSYMLYYSGISSKMKSKEFVFSLLLIPVAILSGILVVNWGTGIIFGQNEQGEYTRGKGFYVSLSYILIYIYYITAFIIIIFTFIKNRKKSDIKSKHLKLALVGFTIIPIVGGVLQLLYPNYPYHAMCFTLSAFIIFIFDIIEERDFVAAENLRAHQKVVLDKCSKILEENSSVELNINSLLHLIGEYYNADRVFILEFNNEQNLVDCTYEWCKDGVTSQIDNIKNIPVQSLGYWMNRYKNGEDEMTVEVEDIKNIDPNLYKMCNLYGIKNMMNSVLKSGGKLYGFIGLDNPIQSSESFRIIRTISVYIYSEILRRNNILNEQKTSGAVLYALADDYTSVYYINALTDELKPYRYNSQMKKHFEKLYQNGTTYSNAYEIYVNEVVYSEDRDEMLEFGKIENLQKKLKNRKNIRKQYRSTINGKVEYFQAKWVKADDINSPITGLILGFTNIDEQVKNNELIDFQKTQIEKQKNEITTVNEKMAFAKRNSQIDRLTGLFNKPFGQHLIEEYITLKDAEENYVLMFLDIDHFKGFNDCYGHLVGDEVLIAVGNAIKSICRVNDIAVRFGGDEFVVLFKNVKDRKVAMSKAIALKNNLKQYSEDKTYNLTCSIGIAITNSIDVAEVINHADKALYEVKNTTRNDVKIYVDEKPSLEKIEDVEVLDEEPADKNENNSKSKKKLLHNKKKD